MVVLYVNVIQVAKLLITEKQAGQFGWLGGVILKKTAVGLIHSMRLQAASNQKIVHPISVRLEVHRRQRNFPPLLCSFWSTAKLTFVQTLREEKNRAVFIEIAPSNPQRPAPHAGNSEIFSVWTSASALTVWGI